MKKVIAVLLLLAFCLVMVSHTGKSPPLEKSKIETIFEKTSDVMAFESPVLNPINFEGMVITGGDMEDRSYQNKRIQLPMVKTTYKEKERCLFLYPNNKNT